MKGKVYLVGGGPGDVDLLTRKAYQLIKEADCIVYDRLINFEILSEAKENCELIYVGKKNRWHTMKQEGINSLLVEKALQYKKVIRLKGGDVFVFGRGSEEALFLKENQIEFEIVPGITSCIAGLSYAGIPVTHRGIAGGFHVVTAHNRQDELADIDFEAMAKGKDTCVFLMGLSKLEEITNRLLQAGMPRDTKAAVISNATLPTQKVIVSNLDEISKKFQEDPLPSPALIVVGDVVELREQLNYFEKKKLFGTKILLPRAGNHASILGKRLKEQGADIKEVQTGLLKEITYALDQISYEKYTYIILTSKNAVAYFLNSLHKNKIDIRKLHGITFAVIGKGTKECLEDAGIYDAIVPEEFHQDALYELLRQQLNPDDHILFPKVKIKGRKGESEQEKKKESLEEKLAEICPVDTISLYENIQVGKEMMKEVLLEKDFDMVIFTCSSCVHRTFEEDHIMEALDGVKVVSIGEKTSETLREYGVKDFTQSAEATFDSVLDTVITLCEKNNA